MSLGRKLLPILTVILASLLTLSSCSTSKVHRNTSPKYHSPHKVSHDNKVVVTGLLEQIGGPVGYVNPPIHGIITVHASGRSGPIVTTSPTSDTGSFSLELIPGVYTFMAPCGTSTTTTLRVGVASYVQLICPIS